MQSKSQSDPVSEWYTKIENEIFKTNVTEYTKNKILENAKFVSEFMGENSLVRFSNETGGIINTLEESSIKTGMANANRKYRQLYVAQIIRYWVEILRELNYITIKSNSEDIPYFREMFTIFFNDDKYLLNRRNFESIR